MPTSAQKRHTILAFTLLFWALAFAPSTANAQTNERSSTYDEQSPAQNLFHPRTFLLPPSVMLPSSITANTAVGGSEPSQGGSSQSPVKGLPISVKSASRNAPRRQELTSINFGPKFVNALFSGFEQGAGIGFGVELTTADAIPGIELRARALTSTRFYRRFELSAYLPRIGDDKNHAELWFTYMRRTRDTFFGIGSRSNEADRTNFDIETRDLEGMFFRDFTPVLQAGVYLGRLSIANYRGQFEDEPPIDTLFSGNPAVQPITRWVPGLKVPLKFFAYGAFLELDARNDDSGLTRGGYLYARIASADGFNNPVATTYGWTEGQLDGRVYAPIFSNKTSIAFRAMADLRSPKGGSQVPYFANAFLGGRSYVRGYSNYRFRSHNLLLFSGEFRQTVFPFKEDQGIDVAVFGDVGRSWGDTRSRTNAAIIRNDRFGDAPWRTGYGPAVQFRFNKDFAVRLDWAHSPERNILYFSISRGF